MFRQLVVFCATVSVALGAVAIAQLEEKPERYKDVEGCYIGKLDTIIPIGEAKPSNESCMEYRCYKDYVQYVSCGAVAASPPCKTVQYLEKTYPDCCKKVECPEKKPNSEEDKEDDKEDVKEDDKKNDKEDYKEDDKEDDKEEESEEMCEDNTEYKSEECNEE